MLSLSHLSAKTDLRAWGPRYRRPDHRVLDIHVTGCGPDKWSFSSCTLRITSAFFSLPFLWSE